ncbi:MAG TPA: DsbE family thiol:disulfide interchange protein [Hyphomicrobiaceae bacterium]|jgi:cytochrome c biogenesis protein CcmG/thiol:disulfide interchange protein DsbE|nr:DsbE family thiol:disulfide interchange protein [Hyphomicrobiaceae bacterium]
MQKSARDLGPAPSQPRRFLLVPVIVFAGLALLLGFALQTGDPSKLPSALIGKPVPQFGLAGLEGLVEEGQPVPGLNSSDLARGEVSVVNFWASWCLPCVEEHPLLAELKRRTGADLYGINYKDQTAAARRFLGRYGNPFKAVGVDGNGRAAIEWGVYGMPETFIVNGEGRIVYKHVGPITPETLEGKLVPMIDAARRAAQPKV